MMQLLWIMCVLSSQNPLATSLTLGSEKLSEQGFLYRYDLQIKKMVNAFPTSFPGISFNGKSIQLRQKCPRYFVS